MCLCISTVIISTVQFLYILQVVFCFIYYILCLFQVIGSSLLFVHDHSSASVWLIDFAKTLLLPEEISINHSSHWTVGNHEDGYLIGINNLITLFLTLLEHQAVCITPPLSVQDPSEWNEQRDDPN